ncbi:nucleotide-binding protein [Pseudomonas sp. 39167]|uniref:nucleotide-binding protein n=1 Tax=Pseudomonas sp. 39167 TaxID=2967215 RepID=UPI0023642B34|nr:nucleotide-binding protein [Pseudomonas sp. 39167]MDD2034238.1 nucleotide-binding protein [Pseudomonas sp. 39167]
MARKTTPPTSTAPKLQLSAREIKRGIERIDERISELESFNVGTLVSGGSPELTALTTAIKDTLERCFGENTSAYNRFLPAAKLHYSPMMFVAGGPPIDYVTPTRRNIGNAVALLNEAKRSLGEDLKDLEHNPSESSPTQPQKSELSRRVFVVHGHDTGSRETLARFLDRMDFEPIILHEQANQGRTIIEKVEAHGDVGFAVVLLTPDDEGSVKGGISEPRARQNVLLELGYFIGRLGRSKVCALKHGTVEIPSDFAGVVWEKMDDAGGWKQALARELQAAGYDVDWNKLMKR